MDPKEQRRVDEFILFGIAGPAKQAVVDSGWEPNSEEDLQPHRRSDRLGHHGVLNGIGRRRQSRCFRKSAVRVAYRLFSFRDG